MGYLNFVPAGTSGSGKTKRWEVRNQQGATLGWISWYAQWRKYTFSIAGLTFDAGCLRDIMIHLETETEKHKTSETPTGALTVRRPNCF